jgi:predicted DCC family thiol-disulfide oxidoreductase YuxK
MQTTQDKTLILFDGICNFCNNTVNFVLKHDKKDRFRFAALQSDSGKKMLLQYGLDPGQSNSIVLIEDGKAYLRSSAALHIAKNLGGIWVLMMVFSLVPVFIRDGIYNWVSRNRYKWFGKRETCRIPDELTKRKFI